MVSLTHGGCGGLYRGVYCTWACLDSRGSRVSMPARPAIGGDPDVGTGSCQHMEIWTIPRFVRFGQTIQGRQVDCGCDLLVAVGKAPVTYRFDGNVPCPPDIRVAHAWHKHGGTHPPTTRHGGRSYTSHPPPSLGLVVGDLEPRATEPQRQVVPPIGVGFVPPTPTSASTDYRRQLSRGRRAVRRFFARARAREPQIHSTHRFRRARVIGSADWFH